MNSPGSMTRFLLRAHRSRRRALFVLVAAMPVFQTVTCYPDFVGALNFQLQFLFNTVLVDTVNTIVRNILGL